MPSEGRQDSVKLNIMLGWIDVSTAVSTVVGVVFGGLINAFFSWRASRELRREPERLRQYNVALLRLLEPTIHDVATVEGGDPIVVRHGSAHQAC